MRILKSGKSVTKLQLFIFFLFISVNINAQIRDEINSFVDSSEILVNNGRRMILKKISENDISKVNEIYQYLNSLTLKNNYVAFNYTENLYLNILIGNWNKLTEYMADFNNKIKEIPFPSTYSMSGILYDRIYSSVDSFALQSQISDMDKESKKVVGLFIYLLKIGFANGDYNERLMSFRKEYKESKYEDFLDKFLPGDKYQFSWGISMGSGMVITTGKLADDFKSNALFNAAMDFNVQKIYASFYFNGSALKLKTPFNVLHKGDSLKFEMNESFSYFEFGLKGGYFLIKNERIHFSPYVSISGTSLESKRYDSDNDDKEYKIFSSFSYGGGVHTEFKIMDFNLYEYGNSMRSYLSLKLDGGYNFLAEFNDKYSDINLPYFNFSIVWGFGEF
jgi:hypothetical protein